MCWWQTTHLIWAAYSAPLIKSMRSHCFHSRYHVDRMYSVDKLTASINGIVEPSNTAEATKDMLNVHSVEKKAYTVFVFTQPNNICYGCEPITPVMPLLSQSATNALAFCVVITHTVFDWGSTITVAHGLQWSQSWSILVRCFYSENLIQHWKAMIAFQGESVRCARAQCGKANVDGELLLRGKFH